MVCGYMFLNKIPLFLGINAHLSHCEGGPEGLGGESQGPEVS